MILQQFFASTQLIALQVFQVHVKSLKIILVCHPWHLDSATSIKSRKLLSMIITSTRSLYFWARWHAARPPIDLPQTPILPRRCSLLTAKARTRSASRLLLYGSKFSKMPYSDSPQPLQFQQSTLISLFRKKFNQQAFGEVIICQQIRAFGLHMMIVGLLRY